jgi:hypothetical protein
VIYYTPQLINVLSVALPGMARDFDFAYIAD